MRGFTLVELMITLTVAAILLAIAIPSVSFMVRSVRSTSATNDFVGALNRARNEALVQPGNVVFCASNNNSASSPNCAGTWNDGWIIFNDCDNDQTPDYTTATCDIDGDGTAETNETLIRTGAALGADDDIGGTANAIVYLSNGTVDGINTAQTFDVCMHGVETGSRIEVNPVGRIMTSDMPSPC